MRREEADRAVAPEVAAAARRRPGCGCTSVSSNSKTGSSSTAVMPSDFRYGIFSMTAGERARDACTPELGERVKPPTCIS